MPNFKILNEFEDLSLAYKNEFFEIYKGYKTIDNEDEKAFFIKIWNVSNSDLLIQEVWLYEIRQLQALKNFSNAQNYLSLIYNYYRDNDCFAIIYECNSLSERFYGECLSSDFHSSEFTDNYIFSKRRIEDPNNRKELWRELLQLAHGIRILHEKGLLHRNISIDNLLINVAKTKNGKHCISKFRLTGFDWLLSLNSFDNTPNLFKSEIETELSFDNDWYLFGKLIQHFLFINEINVETLYDSLPAYLTKSEKSLISSLMSTQEISNDLYKTNYIDYAFVMNKIEEIITTLSTQNAPELNYVLLPPNDYGVIQSKYSNNGIPPEPEQLSRFIVDDLNLTEYSVTKVPRRRGKNHTYLLHGSEFIYKIESHYNRANSKYDWYKAKIKDIYIKKPSWVNFSSITKNFNIKISINKETEVKSLSWLSIINSFPVKSEISPDSKSFLNSMLLSYSLEVSDYLARIFVVNTQPISTSNINSLKVTISQQQLHEQYCRLIHDKPMMGLLNELIKKESSSYEKEWILSLKIPNNKKDFTSSPDERSSDFDSRSFKAELIYDNRKDGYYNFTLSENFLLTHKFENIEKYFKNHSLYLYPKSLKGSYSAVLRKKYALNLISNNDLLIKSIINPTDFTLKLDYPFAHIPETEQLDTSKKEIYKKILETYPNFVVQGPPGVGKTFLITTLLKQIFTDEKSSRIILTAQSHGTMQVLYKEILALGLPKDLIQVNEFSQEDETTDSSLGCDIEQLTTANIMNQTLTDLLQSDLWKDSYKNYNSLREPMDEFTNKNSIKYKSLQDKIINCANIVLTTTNSRTVEEILKNETYADWSIMEESGKASGLELISPLMLAPKRLIIGDHKQLPAFFEKNLHKILEKLTYQDLLIIYQPILSGAMKPDFIDLLEINQFIEEIETVLNQKSSNTDDDYNSSIVDIQNEFNTLKEATIVYFSLLHYLVKKSEKIKDQNPSKIMGEIITEQYRMHPNISKLISHVFYQKMLTNNKANEVKFLDIKNRPFYYSSEYKYSGLLNRNSGIHFLNIKEPNEESGIKSIEKEYVNEAEVYIIENILKNLNINNKLQKKTNLIILSPYKKQVDFINNKIYQLKIIDSLLKKGFEIKGSELCKTIDSFQGGEADLVIVSLVRHNINNDIYKALGFLLDMRRLNVMLSRAKFQMIIIGSLGMFRYWIENAPQHISEDIIDKLKLLYGLITEPSQNIAEIIDVTDSVKDFF